MFKTKYLKNNKTSAKCFNSMRIQNTPRHLKYTFLA